MRTSGWTMTTLATVAGTTLLASTVGASAADLRIADIAPAQASVILGVDDFTQAKAAFDRTGLRAIWDEPSIQEWFNEISEEFFEEFDDALEKIDANREDLAIPTGMAGAAIWIITPEDPDVPFIQFIAAADFGDNAQSVHDTILSALDKGEETQSLIYNREEIGNAVLFTITEVDTPEEDNANDEDDWDDWGDDWDDQGGPEYDTVFYARSGNYLILSSSRIDTENAIDRIDGKDIDAAADNARYRNAFAGLTDQRHAYAVLLNAPLFDITETVQETLGQPILPILDALGISEIESAAATLRFDSDRGTAESDLFVRIPEKRAILSLIDVPAIDFTPPAFVTADSSSVSVFQFDLSRLLPTIMQALNTLPPEIGGELLGGMQMAQGFAGPILSQLGSQITISQTIQRPFAADSQRILGAISVKDAQALSTAITNLQGMIGFQSRDFQGNTIWSMPAGMGAPEVALGIGFGHLFIGPPSEIENAMRAAGAGAGASLKDQAAFKKAMAALSGRGLSYSYSNLEKSLEYFQWMAKNYKTVMREQLRAQFGDFMTDEEIEEMIQFNPASEIYENLPDLDIIRKHIGDTVSEFSLSNDGIRSRSILLRPAD